MVDTVGISVVCAYPEEQTVLPLEVAAGTTLGQVCALPEVRRLAGDADLDPERVGVFGELKSPDYVPREGDRVEIYRPLIMDPKEARRKRAQAG